MTRKTVLLAALLAVGVAFAQANGSNGASKSSLASARAKITQVIENPKLMTQVMRSLSSADQKTFLADVNAAISSMPGNDAERAAAFVAVNDAALAGSQKGNSLTLVAEVFATVPVYALPAVTESLSSGLMNRASDRSTTYTDDQYVKIAQTVMEKVNERVASEDNAGVRSAFAGIMLIQASNSEAPDIITAIVETVPEASRNDAKTEWFPAATGENKSYDAILAAAEVDPAQAAIPDAADTAAAGQRTRDATTERMIGLRISGAQNRDSLLADMSGSGTDPASASDASNPVVDAVQNTINAEIPAGAGEAGADAAEIVGRIVKDQEESRGYPFQETK